MTSTLRFIFALVCLHLALVGCGRPSNKTTDKGPGGLPKQQFDSTGQFIAWELPKELEYPNMKMANEDNNRIYRSPDTPETIAKFFLEKLPGAQMQEINGKRHVSVSNEEYEIDILHGGDQSEITYTPVQLGKPANAGKKCGAA